METRYIREFVNLAETLSYSESARLTHISQSSLSRHIQMMEKELGEALLKRTTRKVELTEFGRAYLPWARKLADMDQKTERAMNEYVSNRSNTVRIGITHNPQLYYITDIMMRFRQEHPSILIYAVEGDLTDLEHDFENGVFHLVTMAFPEWEKPKSRFIPAGSSCLVAVLPKEHILASYEEIPLYRLKNINMMLPGKSTMLYTSLMHVLDREGIKPNIVYEGSLSGNLDMLRNDMGLMIMDEKVASLIHEDDVVVRKLQPEIRYIFGLEYGTNLSRAERTYVNFARKILTDSR